jgi:hypothetical protein
MALPVHELDHPHDDSIVAVNMETSGLGNRVQFTMAVASVAEATGRTLKVYWPLNALFACPADRIWTNFPGEMIAAQELPPLGPEVLTDWRTITPEFWPTVDDPTVYLRGYGGIPQPVGSRLWGEVFRELEATPEVRELVEEAWAALPRDAGVLGVSMRVNEKSHPKTKEHSPVDWYVAELERFSTANPKAGIFLSCDELDVTEQLKAKFPNIVAVDYPSEYNSERGVIKAVADLYILASSTEIIAPYWSSFPTMSYQLAGEQVPMRSSLRSWPAARGADPSIASDPVWPSHRRTPVTDWMPFT